MHDETDRLFAAGALLHGILDEGALVRGLLLAAHEPAKSLVDVLVGHGLLAGSEQERFSRSLEKRLDDATSEVDRRELLHRLLAQHISEAVERVRDPILRRYLNGDWSKGQGIDGSDGRESCRLLELYRRGGFGEVWRGHEVALDREVAVKQLRAQSLVNDEARRRFLREAQVIARLQHPNIVPIYSIWTDERGNPRYSMRFVEGRTFDEVIQEFHASTSERRCDPVRLNILMSIFLDVCDAVAFAHSREIVHRDLKPANIMVSGFGQVVVLDWGLAKILGGADEGSERPLDENDLSNAPCLEETREGLVVGSPLYMAPEQAAGTNTRVGPATDIYGLGAILFKVLTGESPHQRHAARNAKAHFEDIVHAETPRVRRLARWVPKALDAICARAMEKEPSERYESVGELELDIRRWLVGEPVAAYPEPTRARVARWFVRRRLGTLLCASFLVLTAVLASASMFLVDTHQQVIDDEMHRQIDRSMQSQQKLFQQRMVEIEGDLQIVVRLSSVRQYLDHVLESDNDIRGEEPKTILEDVGQFLNSNRDYRSIGLSLVGRGPDLTFEVMPNGDGVPPSIRQTVLPESIDEFLWECRSLPVATVRMTAWWDESRDPSKAVRLFAVAPLTDPSDAVSIIAFIEADIGLLDLSTHREDLVRTDIYLTDHRGVILASRSDRQAIVPDATTRIEDVVPELGPYYATDLSLVRGDALSMSGENWAARVEPVNNDLFSLDRSLHLAKVRHVAPFLDMIRARRDRVVLTELLLLVGALIVIVVLFWILTPRSNWLRVGATSPPLRDQRKLTG
ncbi:Serine/threonine-protein kinase PknD [Planctomycetes bacterium Pan216]|uniref:Serine/threonine-protein kinase PknD n=1 Tax=Kolteria novifilia TaxID=2527975 RepID=A0A518B4D9_9BACT|nr:Serine/threonine-protein kinase PknD [Planctomycetes bacterium Pan216]